MPLRPVSTGLRIASGVAALRGRIGGAVNCVAVPDLEALAVAMENASGAERAICDADFASDVAAITRAQLLARGNTATA